MQSADILRGNDHYYYRYANAQHGSVVAALSGKRRNTYHLLSEGLRVAFKVSPEPYDQIKTYKINRRGLVQMAAAAALILFGNKTPILANFARKRLVR
jgi:hypothetical protein